MRYRKRDVVLLLGTVLVALLPLTFVFIGDRSETINRSGNEEVVLYQSVVRTEAVRQNNDADDKKDEPVIAFQNQRHFSQQQQQLQDEQQQHQEAGQKMAAETSEDMFGALHRLLDQMERDWHFWWIRNRIQSMWPEFEAAGRKLRNTGCEDERQRKQVMILPGVLQLTNFARPEVIRKGGPLGELMQWADLIAGSHALCHDVIVRSQFSSTIAQLRSDDDPSDPSTSASGGCSGSLDFIYTDISGFRSLPEDVINTRRQRFRIADAFGTEAAYNDPEYAATHGTAIDKWGMLNLTLKQFYTLYPHTPDNSFLGFVVSNSKLLVNSTKENYALLMGKEVEYLRGKEKILSTIHEVFPLRTTMPFMAMGLLPVGAENLGVLGSSEYQDLLQKAKVCVGLGDPVESPGVMEAIAQGCVFLNPRRTGDRSMLSGKPTARRVTSQVPYLEEYVGPPHVYTIDDNIDELKRVLMAIREQKVEPFLPYEFSVDGYLQRLHAFSQHQDLCELKNLQGRKAETIWPPVSALQLEIAPYGVSCKRACFDKGLTCEPAFFPIINSPEYLSTKTNLSCSSVQFDAEIYSPAYFASTKTCSFQRNSRLFSCASGELTNASRICPCRDFQPFQLALCKQCT